MIAIPFLPPRASLDARVIDFPLLHDVSCASICFSLLVLSTPSVVACHSNGSCSSTMSYVRRSLASHGKWRVVVTSETDEAFAGFFFLLLLISGLIFIVMVGWNREIEIEWLIESAAIPDIWGLLGVWEWQVNLRNLSKAPTSIDERDYF